MVQKSLLLATVILLTALSISKSASSTPMFNIRQSINIPGMKVLLTVIKNPAIAVPSIELKHLNDLDLEYLKREKVACVVFDKDNTLR